MNRSTAATLGLAVPAAMALGMSANTSYRFLGARLAITLQWERGLLCGVAEAAILALTVYAWATQTKGAAWLAYGIVLVQAVPAFEVSGTAGGVIRVLLGPVLLATMLHLLLGLEVRMSGARPDGILRAALRELRERLTAYLGIGRRGADSAAIARSRAADRAVMLADRVEGARKGSRRYRRGTARLADAIDAARHGLEGPAADAAESVIVGRIVRRKSVAGLATITDRHDWTAAAPTSGTPVPAVAEHRAPAVPAAEQVPAPRAEHTEPLAELTEVPAAEQVPATVPALEVPEPVDGGTTGGVSPEPLAASVGSAPEHGRNHTPARPAARNTGSAGSTRPALEVVGTGTGTRAEHIRAMVASGITETGTIRNLLTEHGVAVPSDRYIRRLVSEARAAAEQATGTNGYM
jgi:hypothetical protein